MSDALLRRCLLLPVEARRQLTRQLVFSFDAKPEDAASRYAVMKATMEEATGEPLSPCRRDNRNSWRRAIIAATLAEEGFSETQIGAAMGRDHSSVNAMKRNVKKALSYPTMYGDVLDTLYEFKLKLKRK